MSNITKVYLLKVPLESDYKHTLYFGSSSAQQSYFQSKVVYSFTDFSYQRKDEKIRIPVHYDEICTCNYVMYQNKAHGEKWFYAFITDMKYINDGVTEVFIKTDVIQTWLFDYTVKQSFIEREHTNDDSFGANTVPEALETGEYICNSVQIDNNLKECVYVVCTTEFTGDSADKPLAVDFGGIFSAGGAYICTTMNQVVNIVGGMKNDEAITNVYMIPKKIVNDSDPETLLYEGQSKPVTYSYNVLRQTTLNGYEPKNNKLLCYPYNYILMSNNAGSSNILRYEDFTTSNCQFEIAGIPVVGGSIKCTPKNYKGIEKMQEEGIMAGKFPVLSWSSDNYTNWLTQNSLNNVVGFATDGLKVIGGVIGAVATGGAGSVVGGGLAVSGVTGIVGRLTNIHEHSFTPNSAKGNTNAGDINTAHEMNLFHFYKMSIKFEYASIIDHFFTMFGYKVNAIKTPNKNHRSNFWYTKTVDCDIDGEIPIKDIQEIKECYNRGITFWKNPDNISNYNVTNSIV